MRAYYPRRYALHVKADDKPKDDRPDRSEETDAFLRLERTHRRIEERLIQLEDAVAALADPARREHAVADLFEVARFFGRAAVRHHDDEEETLFPRLLEHPELAPLLAALRVEHDEHDRATAPLLDMVQGWDDAGPSAREERELPAIVRRLADVYRAHIRREEHELFPAARRALPAGAAVEMGREMQARRGK
jgi:hemerythrin-like domain-containing protein